jgi:hypothetical protein
MLFHDVPLLILMWRDPENVPWAQLSPQEICPRDSDLSRELIALKQGSIAQKGKGTETIILAHHRVGYNEFVNSCKALTSLGAV